MTGQQNPGLSESTGSNCLPKSFQAMILHAAIKYFLISAIYHRTMSFYIPKCNKLNFNYHSNDLNIYVMKRENICKHTQFFLVR